MISELNVILFVKLMVHNFFLQGVVYGYVD